MATKVRKKARTTTAQKAKNKAAKATMSNRIAAAVVAAAAIWNVSKVAATARVNNIRKNLEGLGTVRRKPNGRTVVYSDQNILFNFSKSRHVKGAKRKVDGECPLARALKDSFLRDYITHAHVGNHTVKMWSVLCPELVVKFALSPALAAAVREWDDTGRWTEDDGLYAIISYPNQPRLGPDGRGTIIVKPPKNAYGPRTKSPTRRITLQSDIALAMEAATLLKKKKSKKNAA